MMGLFHAISRKAFSMINTVFGAMQAHEQFQGFQCPLCKHPFWAGHVCSVEVTPEDFWDEPADTEYKDEDAWSAHLRDGI